MTDSLDELDALRAAATPGPWEYSKNYAGIFGPNPGPRIATMEADGALAGGDADAAFIVAACNAAGPLIERVREAEAANASETSEPMRREPHPIGWCDCPKHAHEMSDSKERLVQKVRDRLLDPEYENRLVALSSAIVDAVLRESCHRFTNEGAPDVCDTCGRERVEERR